MSGLYSLLPLSTLVVRCIFLCEGPCSYHASRTDQVRIFLLLDVGHRKIKDKAFTERVARFFFFFFLQLIRGEKYESRHCLYILTQ